jgi:8-oxo-dGTP pyrophosphatase MutT (NUDIX family)
MTTKRGPYTVLSSEVKYKNSWISVREDKIIRPNGKEGVYGIIEYGEGVTVVALNKNREIFLVKEYCYAIDEYNLSCPSGGVDSKETPLDAAKRELSEEAGVTSDKWFDLGYIHPFTMIINSPVTLFLALDAEIKQEHEEENKLYTMPFSEAYQMVIESRINHAGSCMAIMKAKYYLDNNH